MDYAFLKLVYHNESAVMTSKLATQCHVCKSRHATALYRRPAHACGHQQLDKPQQLLQAASFLTFASAECRGVNAVRANAHEMSWKQAVQLTCQTQGIQRQVLCSAERCLYQCAPAG